MISRRSFFTAIAGAPMAERPAKPVVPSEYDPEDPDHRNWLSSYWRWRHQTALRHGYRSHGPYGPGFTLTEPPIGAKVYTRKTGLIPLEEWHRLDNPTD